MTLFSENWTRRTVRKVRIWVDSSNNFHKFNEDFKENVFDTLSKIEIDIRQPLKNFKNPQFRPLLVFRLIGASDWCIEDYVICPKNCVYNKSADFDWRLCRFCCSVRRKVFSSVKDAPTCGDDWFRTQQMKCSATFWDIRPYWWQQAIPPAAQTCTTITNII